MTSRSRVVRSLTAILAAVITLVLFVTASHSADETATAELLIDTSTEGYYNASIGNKLDGLLPWFPAAPVSPEPTVDPPGSEPDNEELVTRAGLVALLEEDPLPLGSGWGSMQLIPRGWARTTETAVIYEIDAGAKGIKDLTGNFGVDNGIYVWVDGRFKFGAMEPGGAPLGEYPDVPLDDLGPGKHYLQVLREDHGAATGYAIEVSGTRIVSDTVVFGRATGPGVFYDDRPQPVGQDFVIESCNEERSITDESCTLLTLVTPQIPAAEPERPGIVINCTDPTSVGELYLQWFVAYYTNPKSEVVGDAELAIWFAQLKVDSICFSPLSRTDNEVPDYSIGLQHGAGLIRNPLVGQRLAIDAQLALVDVVGPATVAVGYVPDDQEAFFLAFNSPITLTPPTGAPLVLGAGQQVTLTVDGFGPISGLPRIFLPSISR